MEEKVEIGWDKISEVGWRSVRCDWWDKKVGWESMRWDGHGWDLWDDMGWGDRGELDRMG